MSGFLDLTPTVQIIIENQLLRRFYPTDGSVNAIIDTGYRGFLCVPNPVFQGLGLNELRNEQREVALADGTRSNASGCYATMRIPHLSMKIDGFVETFAGLEETILGVEALNGTRVLLDYCAGRVRIERCKSK